jgi:hypothetical protein
MPLRPTDRTAIIQKENVIFVDKDGVLFGSCSTKELNAKTCKALFNGEHFEIPIGPGRTVALSYNKKSLCVRDILMGRFFGLVSIRYLSGKLCDILSGREAKAEIDLVEVEKPALPAADGDALVQYYSQVAGAGGE